MEDPNASVPISSSTDDALVPDPGSQIGSAHGSFQNEGLLGGAAGGGDGGSSSSIDAEFGFLRPNFGKGPIAGTVQIYERHVFLCYKDPQVWPSHVETAEFDRLPRLLSAAVTAGKSEMKKRTRLTLCEGEDGTESSNGDVLIFPDMIRYRRLTHFDVENFVEEVLVKDAVWLPGTVEKLTGSYVFVCSHGNRDQRCGTCGPVVIKKFKEEIQARGLEGQVSVSPCSHVGGHKYAGNVIIFSPNVDGEVTGHWYGYVSPDDVPLLLEQHIGKGEAVTHLWRGQMGLTEEEQKKAHDLRLQLNDENEGERGVKESTPLSGNLMGSTGCCQGVGNSTCCQNLSMDEKPESHLTPDLQTKKPVEMMNGKESKAGSSKGGSTHKVCAMPTWFETWEREDTYAALAVTAAVVSVAVAYGCYRQLR